MDIKTIASKLLKIQQFEHITAKWLKNVRNSVRGWN